MYLKMNVQSLEVIADGFNIDSCNRHRGSKIMTKRSTTKRGQLSLLQSRSTLTSRDHENIVQPSDMMKHGLFEPERGTAKKQPN